MSDDLPEQLVEKDRRMDFAFPDRDHIPAKAPERGRGANVAFHVCLELRCPEVCSCSRSRGESTGRMPVPEASVDKDDRSVPCEDDIRRSREPAVIDPEAQARPVEIAPHGKLRGGVPASNTGHHSRARLRADDVGHGCSGKWLSRAYLTLPTPVETWHHGEHLVRC